MAQTLPKYTLGNTQILKIILRSLNAFIATLLKINNFLVLLKTFFIILKEKII
jgi:hypothetical protein